MLWFANEYSDAGNGSVCLTIRISQNQSQRLFHDTPTKRRIARHDDPPKNASTEPQFAALIGIDWADQKHDVCLCEMDSDQSEHRVVEQTPEAIDEWVTQLRQRLGDAWWGLFGADSRRLITR